MRSNERQSDRDQNSPFPDAHTLDRLQSYRESPQTGESTLHRQRVLISGTSSGFGALSARRLAQAGHHVYAGMRDIDSRHSATAAALREFAHDHELSIEVLELDVTLTDSVTACVDHIRAAGGLDAVVHNAGVAAAGLTETFTADNAERIFAVNVVGVVRLQHALLPLLRDSSQAASIYVTSTLAREVMPFLSVYSASKHALDALAEGWRYELGQIGIRTVIIQPGTFPTTGMLTRLIQPGAPDRAEAYGAFAEAPGGLFAGLQDMIAAGAAPDPMLVADATLAALSPEAPTRIVVDPAGNGSTARLNAASRAEQQALLTGLGLTNLD